MSGCRCTGLTSTAAENALSEILTSLSDAPSCCQEVRAAKQCAQWCHFIDNCGTKWHFWNFLLLRSTFSFERDLKKLALILRVYNWWHVCGWLRLPTRSLPRAAHAAPLRAPDRLLTSHDKRNKAADTERRHRGPNNGQESCMHLGVTNHSWRKCASGPLVSISIHPKKRVSKKQTRKKDLFGLFPQEFSTVVTELIQSSAEDRRIWKKCCFVTKPRSVNLWHICESLKVFELDGTEASIFGIHADSSSASPSRKHSPQLFFLGLFLTHHVQELTSLHVIQRRSPQRYLSFPTCQGELCGRWLVLELLTNPDTKRGAVSFVGMTGPFWWIRLHYLRQIFPFPNVTNYKQSESAERRVHKWLTSEM